MWLKRWSFRAVYAVLAVFSACALVGVLVAILAGRHATADGQFWPTPPHSIGEALQEGRALAVAWLWPSLVCSGWAVLGTVFLIVASVWLLDAAVRGWRQC